MAHQQNPQLYVIVLAAGKGTRMKSSIPKVLHTLAGKPMIGHVLDNVDVLKPSGVFVICGHGADQLKQWAANDQRDLIWVEQKEQLGTGHAVRIAMQALNDAGVGATDRVLIVSGDVPLTPTSVLQELCTQTSAFALLTVILSNPFGYGRILRNQQQQVVGVVEEKDSNDQQRLINEVNTNVMVLEYGTLQELVPLIQNNNTQGEYYLPDLVGLATQRHYKIVAVQASHDWEVQGVNDRVQLEQLERTFQKNQVHELMKQGLGVVDSQRLDVRGTLKFGQDCKIDINAIFEGQNELGDTVSIGQNVRLVNTKIGNNVAILSFCDIEGAIIGDNCTVGPFARLRCDAVLESKAKIGNFVELKKSILHVGAKVNHLAYVGDCEIGRGSNIGAGTILCNYDGVSKHQTTIGDEVFVGSNCSLVAPLAIGDGATVGAGSVVTTNVPADCLAVGRVKPSIIKGWKRPKKDQIK